MKVIRTTIIETEDFQIGDRISVELNGLGTFNATAHKLTEKGALFIFDEYVASCQMNDEWTNKGGFVKSDLKQWMDTTLLPAFPDNLRNRVIDLSIPSVGEMFGHDDEWFNKTFEKDTDEQLPLMKDRRNRIAYLDGQLEWGWLRNATKKSVSSSNFAIVGSSGRASYNNASNSYGVRPEFWLVK